MLRNILIKIKQNNIKCSQQMCYVTQTAAGKEISSQTPQAEYELKQEHIDEAIKANPSLKTVSPEMWKKCYDTFFNHGLTTNNFLRIAVGNPKVLMRSPQKIIETLEYWRSCQFGEYFLFLLITKYPTLMDISDKRKLLNQTSFLKSYVGSSKNVWKLLMSCPELIEQSEEAIEAKIMYIKDKMRIEIPEMVKSESLAKSLDDIKVRHVFLERLGLFKPRPLKADPNEPTKNPRLYKITDTSEKRFATKICHVTLAEYEAFKMLYYREVERKEQKEDGDDEDDLFSDEEK